MPPEYPRIERVKADSSVRRYFRLLLTEARADALADAEAAERVIFAIEALARYLAGQAESLERTSPALCTFVGRQTPNALTRFAKLLSILRFGRNDRMHKGFAARNLARDAVRVSLILEDALKVDWSRMTAQDVMTPSPTVAELWMSFGRIRDFLIENAYSQIPIRLEQGWRVVTERKLASLVQELRRRGGSHDIRELELSSARPSQLGAGPLIDALVETVPLIRESTPVTDLVICSGCILVHRDSDQSVLVGIITPSDIV